MRNLFLPTASARAGVVLARLDKWLAESQSTISILLAGFGICAVLAWHVYHASLGAYGLAVALLAFLVGFLAVVVATAFKKLHLKWPGLAGVVCLLFGLYLASTSPVAQSLQRRLGHLVSFEGFVKHLNQRAGSSASKEEVPKS